MDRTTDVEKSSRNLNCTTSKLACNIKGNFRTLPQAVEKDVCATHLGLKAISFGEWARADRNHAERCCQNDEEFHFVW